MLFPPLYATLSLKNTGITHPVLVDVVSGEIKQVSWKPGTTDTLEALPIKDSIMAVTDESYFDWPVLPEAPSSLNLSVTGNYCETGLAGSWRQSHRNCRGAPGR